MTQTQRITESVYARYNPERLDLTITPLEVVLMAELSDQIPYPHTHALGEGLNVSRRRRDSSLVIGILNGAGVEIACALTVWALYELRYPLAWIGHAIVKILTFF